MLCHDSPWKEERAACHAEDGRQVENDPLCCATHSCDAEAHECGDDSPCDHDHYPDQEENDIEHLFIG